MKRIASLLAVTVGVAAGATAIAAAASSPTVTTAPATSATDTAVVLRALVNPNGNQTGYSFEYGVTAAYGQGTKARSAGHGTKPLAVQLTLRGLTPGTTYYYRVDAFNRSGSAFGAARSFTTTGHPPATVITGSAVNVGQTDATPTGTINPQGLTTTWAVQYGLTGPPYASQTLGQTPLKAASTPVPVQVTLSGLSPGTLYHYRIVATHGSVATRGADQTFFTVPRFRRKTRLKAHTSPSRDTQQPYGFTTSGRLRGASFVPASLRCTGQVAIRYYNRRHQVAFVVTTVGPDCKYSTPVPFDHLIGGGSTALRVKIHYRGNSYLKPATKINHVTLG